MYTPYSEQHQSESEAVRNRFPKTFTMIKEFNLKDGVGFY